MLGKNWKKLLALLLALAMVFSLAACSNTNSSADGDGDDGEGEKTPIIAGDPMQMTPKEHMLLVEKEGLHNAISALMGAYGTEISVPDSIGAEMDLDIRLGDDMIDLLQSYIPEGGFDLSALDKIGMDMTVNYQNDLCRLLLGLALNDKELADIDMIVDMAAMTIWLGLPGLHEQYVKFEMGNLGGGEIANPTVDSVVGAVPTAAVQGNVSSAVGMPMWVSALPQIMPDPEKLEPLLIKYIDIILDNISNVKREEVKLEMDGTQQDAVVLTYTLTEENLADILLALMKAAKDDQALKTLVDELSSDLNSFAESLGESADALDLYPQFKAFLEDGIAYFEEYDGYSDENYYLITTTLDKSNAIIGRSAAMYTDNELEWQLSYKTVSDDTVCNIDLRWCAFSRSVSGSVGGEPVFVNTKHEIIFQGHNDLRNGAVVGGSYTFRTATGNEVTDWVTIELSDCTETTGKLTIEPTAALLRTIFGSEAGALDLALQFIVNNEKFTTNLLLNDELLIGVDVTAAEKAVTPIQKPANAVDGTDETALQQWLQGLDLNKLIERWNATGMPAINLG